MTHLKIFKFDPCVEVNFEKCPNLKVLCLIFLEVPALKRFQTIPALRSMENLYKLLIFHATISASSLAAFDGLTALNFLEFDHCLFECDWKAFGASLANLPVKSVTFWSIDCCVENIESFLRSVKLEYLYISNFTPTQISASGVFRTFVEAFPAKRDNPSIAFLIEQDGYARIHNGLIVKQIVS